MQQTPLHFGVVTRISCYYVFVCMNAMLDYIACILNIIPITCMHAHGDENIPTWHSCNNGINLLIPAGSTVCMCDSWKQHTFHEREFTKAPHCQSVAMLFYYIQINNVQHVLNYNHGTPNPCAQQMAKSIFSLNRSGSFSARGR